MEGWIVVCTDLHGSIGLYRSEEQAQKVADVATKEAKGGTGCVYKAVRTTITLNDYLN